MTSQSFIGASSQTAETPAQKLNRLAKEQNERENGIVDAVLRGSADDLKRHARLANIVETEKKTLTPCSKETFLEAVEESMEIFGLTRKLAIKEAEIQLSKCGLDASQFVASESNDG
jgi:hypothetical protein